MMKLIVTFFLLVSFSSYPCAKNINVYLRFDSPVLYQTIKQFNNFLENNKLFSSYKIHPFLEKYPLHCTLYLASFPEAHLDKIKYRVAQIAKVWKPIKIKTTKVLLTPGNFVMLDLDMSKSQDGQIQEIQQLSDILVIKLSNLRDFNAKIPTWAEHNSEKKKAFINYGSPNVFFEFSPHISLMAKNFGNPKDEKTFKKKLGHLIQSYSFPELFIESSVIGIGYVNSLGQITREITSYQLKSK